MSSEKEEINFGHKVFLMMLCTLLVLGAVTYTFSLFEPYMSCVNFQAPVDHAQIPIDPAES